MSDDNMPTDGSVPPESGAPTNGDMMDESLAQPAQPAQTYSSGDPLLEPFPITEDGHCKIGDIILEQSLGQIGLTGVYLGTDTVHKRQVIVRLLPYLLFAQPPEFVRAYLNRVISSAKVKSPNLINILGIKKEADVQYVIVEWFDGMTLNALRETVAAARPVHIQNRLDEMLTVGTTKLRTLPEWLALDIGISIAEGLAAAHQAGIVHGDIKPSNVIIPRRPVNGVDGVLHLSTTKLADLDRTMAPGFGEWRGTPGYMAAEHIDHPKNPTKASDVFALGALLYDLLTGRPPYVGETFDEVRENTHHMFLPIRKLAPQVSADTARIINQCLRKDPEKRFEDARALMKELSQARKALTGDLLTADAKLYSDLSDKATVALAPGALKDVLKDISPATNKTEINPVQRKKTRAVSVVPDGPAPNRTATRGASPVAEPAKTRSLLANIGAFVAVLLLLGGGAWAWWTYVEKPRKARIENYDRRFKAAQTSEQQAVELEKTFDYDGAVAAWKSADASYVEALGFKPDDSLAKTGSARSQRRLSQIDLYRTLINDAASARALADTSTSSADILTHLKTALDKVLEALRIFPEDVAALAEKDKTMNRIADIDQFVRLENNAFRARNAALQLTNPDETLRQWETVVSTCDQALKIIPNLESVLMLKTEAEQNRDSISGYLSMIRDARASETAANAATDDDARFDALRTALDRYEQALVMKLGDIVAERGVAQTSDKVAVLKARNEKYRAAMTAAETAFATADEATMAANAIKSLAVAEREYKNALNVRSNDAPARDGLAKTADAISSWQRRDATYLRELRDIRELRRKLSEEEMSLSARRLNLDKLIKSCELAIAAQPGDTIIPPWLAEAQQQLDSLSGGYERYQTLVSLGDTGVAAAAQMDIRAQPDKLMASRRYYEDALLILPGDTRATNAVRNIDIRAAALRNQVATFDDILLSASVAETAARSAELDADKRTHWRTAVAEYNRALGVIRNEPFALAGRDAARQELEALGVDEPVVDIPLPDPTIDDQLPTVDLATTPATPVPDVTPAPDTLVPDMSLTPDQLVVIDDAPVYRRPNAPPPTAFDETIPTFGVQMLTIAPGFGSEPDPGAAFGGGPVFRMIYKEYRFGYKAGLNLFLESEADDSSVQTMMMQFDGLMFLDSHQTYYANAGMCFVRAKTTLSDDSADYDSGLGLSFGLGATVIRKHLDLSLSFMLLPMNDHRVGVASFGVGYLF